LTEGLWQVGISDQVGRQVAYSSDLGHLLRLSGERRREEAASQGADECPPVHYSIT